MNHLIPHTCGLNNDHFLAKNEERDVSLISSTAFLAKVPPARENQRPPNKILIRAINDSKNKETHRRLDFGIIYTYRLVKYKKKTTKKRPVH